MRRINQITGLLLCALFVMASVRAQSALDTISRNPNYAAGNYALYPDTIHGQLTPPPPGKHAFYISHYGRHGSRYLNDRSAYDIPHKMLSQADSLGALTPIGHQVLQNIQSIIAFSDKQWGDLSSHGRRQLRQIAHRMVERFPEVFADSAHVDARSTVVNRCILSMGSAMQEMVRMNPSLKVTMRASQRDMHYMNFQDPVLRKEAMTPEAKQAYDDFVERHHVNERLMNLLFIQPDSARQVVNEKWLNYYVIKMGLFQINTENHKDTFLLSLFKPEELHRLWQWENVWWYIQHGGCLLNKGRQPYTQRHLLRQIIADADSCIQLERPGAQLRFGHETVLLPLVCLMGINGFDVQTANLEEVEKLGWWDTQVFPMGANVQFIFYRTDPSDNDVLFKVLLNEQEARLPITTDCAPYYHWADFRQYYLDKLERYKQQYGE